MSLWEKAKALFVETPQPEIERKEIIGLGSLSGWQTASRHDGQNFRTNQVTLANYNDTISSGGSVLGLSATWACVNLIAGTIGSLPLMVYRTTNGVREVARDHPLYFVLHDSPNFDQTSLDFWEFMAAAVELQGNAYAAIERRNNGSVFSLTPIRPDLVTVRRLSTGLLEYRWLDENGQNVRAVNDVLHIRGAMPTALSGVSALAACRSAFTGAISAENAARNTFANGMRPSGVLSTDPTITLTRDQREEFNGYLQENFQGSVNSGKPMLLDRGMKWQQINITPEDAQMLESRKSTCRGSNTGCLGRLGRAP